MSCHRVSRRAGVVGLFVLALSASITTTGAATLGHAAGMSVSSARVSTFRPAQLPPACTSQTVYADVDTWVNQAAATTTYGADGQVLVRARGGNAARTLVHFPLPANPGSCTLGSATLRLFNAPTTGSTGRTIAVNPAATAWDNNTNYNTMPAPAGTAVNATSAAGWMTWSVKAHVDAFYAGSNTGFVVRDVNEGGPTVYTQQFDSLNRPNRPELILLWQ